MTAAADRVYGEIRGRIISGELPPGARLRELTVADEMGVSRTPVREALRRLAAEGLAVLMPRRGAVVGAWSQTELQEIFELRVLLEGFGAGLAAQKIDDETLGYLDDMAREMERLGRRGSPKDLDRIAELNSTFHQTIARCSGNQRLVSILGLVIDSGLVAHTFQRYREEELARSLAHHVELVTALRVRSREWAENLMRTHLLAARPVLTLAEPDGAPDGVLPRT